MIKTRITSLLGIKYPVIQGGMAWIADANLASAVSNAGGLGIIGAANAPADIVREQIRKVKQTTDQPFGVNIMLMSPHANDIAQLCIDENVKIITTGAGSPGKYMKAWKEAGIIVIPVVPSVNLAKRMEKGGADAVVVEGTEAGGHIGELTTMCLVPQVVDAVSIPVIAAGGIADGRGFGAAIMLGADAVQVGTIFVCATESPAHESYKKLLIDAGDTDTTVTGRSNGHPVRALKNRFTKKIIELEKAGEGFEVVEMATIGSYRKAVQDGDLIEGTFMAGQIAGLVKEIKPAKEIMETLMKDSEDTLKNFLSKRGVSVE